METKPLEIAHISVCVFESDDCSELGCIMCCILGAKRSAILGKGAYDGLWRWRLTEEEEEVSVLSFSISCPVVSRVYKGPKRLSHVLVQ